MLKLHQACLLACAAAMAMASAAALHAQSTHFAIIGDYGVDNSNEQAVANRLKLANPQFILTVGDDNYQTGSLADWDRTQGKYYGQYIKYPAGSASAYAGNGVIQNNFYPALGNHDWDAGISSYTSYFDLPGNERYYSFVRGPVEFFVLDSDPREPDGTTANSTQYNWAQSAIQNSTAKWQMVFFHHPAWTYPTNHSPDTDMRWPFQSWGADAIFSGHDHNMQELDVSGLHYYVQGAGGQSLYPISGQPPDATGLWYNDSTFGFTLIDATDSQLSVQFIDTAGNVLHTSIVPEPLGFSLFLAVPLVARRPRRLG